MTANTPDSLHHVGTTVTDLDRAVAFYTETFGVEELARFTVEGEAFETAVGLPGATGQFAHLDGDGARIELVEYDPADADATADAVNQLGGKHLGFEVEDMDGFFHSLDDDVPTVSEPQTTATGSTILFLEDPDGNLIEVIEP